MSYVADDFDYIAKRVKEFKKQREDLLKEKPKEESNKDKFMEQQLDWFARAIMNSGGAPYKPKSVAPTPSTSASSNAAPVWGIVDEDGFITADPDDLDNG